MTKNLAMKVLFTLALLLSTPFLHAQITYTDDLNYLTWSEYLELIDKKPLNSPYELFRHLGYATEAKDSIEATKLLMQIDPCYFLSKGSSADEVYTYLITKCLIKADSLKKYRKLLMAVFNETRSESYAKFQQMADDLMHLHKDLENCNDSTNYVRVKKAIKLKADVYFPYLYKYVRANGWPSLREGSIPACRLASYDWEHLESYIPVFKKALMDGKVEIDYLKIIYWSLKSTHNSWRYFGDYRYYGKYHQFDIISLANNKLPANITDIEAKLNSHCPVNWVVIVEYKDKKALDEWENKLSNLPNNNNAFKTLVNELYQYKCNAIPETKGSLEYHTLQNKNLKNGLKFTLYVVFEQEDTIIRKFNKIIKDKKIILHKIRFDASKAEIANGEISFLQNLVYWLNKNPLMKLGIDGHTDTEGNPEANMTLSEQRASSIKKYLLENGIDEDRLITKGYGYTKPIFPNSNEKQKALNRRVELTIIQDFK